MTVKNVGAYKQGSPMPHAADEPHEAGVPRLVPRVEPAPPHQPAQREEHKMVGGNDGAIPRH